MFCPKCGNTLPDGAAFCGGCGNRIDVARKSSTEVTSGTASSCSTHVAPMTSQGKLSTLQIAAIIAALFALLTTLGPWLEPSSTLKTYSSGVNALSSIGSSITGKSYGNFELADSYSLWSYVDGLIKITSNTGRIKMDVAAGSEIIWILFNLAYFALIVVGIINFVRKPTRPIALLLVGLIILSVLIAPGALLFSLTGSAEGYCKGITAPAVLCILASFTSIVLCLMAKKETKASS